MLPHDKGWAINSNLMTVTGGVLDEELEPFDRDEDDWRTLDDGEGEDAD